MINENKLTKYYSEIANKLDEIIPCDWNDIVMYAEELGDYETVCFYYKERENDIYRHSGNIPDYYGVSVDIYFELLDELIEVVNELWKEFVEAGEEKWFTLTFHLNKDWKFDVKFGYSINLDVMDSQRELYWAYTELGIIPNDDYEKELLEEYLKEQGKSL